MQGRQRHYLCPVDLATAIDLLGKTISVRSIRVRIGTDRTQIGVQTTLTMLHENLLGFGQTLYAIRTKITKVFA